MIVGWTSSSVRLDVHFRPGCRASQFGEDAEVQNANIQLRLARLAHMQHTLEPTRASILLICDSSPNEKSTAVYPSHDEELRRSSRRRLSSAPSS